MKEIWNRFLRWGGWKFVFPLPFWGELMLFAACGAGLIWVFAAGREQWWPAYLLYGLSGYSLTALCVHLPGALRREQNWVKAHPKVERFLKDKERRFTLELYFQQVIN